MDLQHWRQTVGAIALRPEAYTVLQVAVDRLLVVEPPTSPGPTAVMDLTVEVLAELQELPGFTADSLADVATPAIMLASELLLRKLRDES